MASFTPITSASDMQDVTYYQELENALEERFDIIGGIAEWRIDSTQWVQNTTLTCSYSYWWNGSSWLSIQNAPFGTITGNQVHLGGVFPHAPLRNEHGWRPVFRTFAYGYYPWRYWRADADGNLVNTSTGAVEGFLTYGQNYSTLSAVATVPGDDIQAAAYFCEKQELIEDLISESVSRKHYWMDLGSYGSPPTSMPNYDGSSDGSIPTYATASDVWQNVTNGQNYPRRRTTMSGYPASGWSYGYCQAGDIIGPWLIEDLQDAMSFLRYTAKHVDSQLGGSAETTHETPSLEMWDTYNHSSEYRRQWNGSAGTKSSTLWDSHDHDDAECVDDNPVSASITEDYVARHVAAVFFHGQSPENYYVYFALSTLAYGEAIVQGLNNSYLHKAACYFISETPDSIDGATMNYRDVNSELGVSAAGLLARVAADTSWQTAASRSVTWDQAGGAVDPYFDSGVPEGSSEPALSEIDWYGYQIKAEFWTTFEWVFAYV